MVFINHMEILGGDAAIVAVEGALDSHTSPAFEDYINQLMERNIFYILFDAGKLEYVSSDGIGLTLFIQKKLMQNNGFLVIFSLPEEVSSLFRLLGFEKIFTIAESRIDAMQIMDRQIEMRSSPDEKVAGIPVETEGIPVTARKQDKTAVDEKKPAPGKGAGVADTAALDPEKKVKEEFDPIIVECISCMSMIRVKKSGDYICPACKIEFTVDGNRTVKFK